MHEQNTLGYGTTGCNYIRRHIDHNRYGQHHVMGAIKHHVMGAIKHHIMGAIKRQQFFNMNINPDQHSHSRGDRG